MHEEPSMPPSGSAGSVAVRLLEAFPLGTDGLTVIASILVDELACDAVVLWLADHPHDGGSDDLALRLGGAWNAPGPELAGFPVALAESGWIPPNARHARQQPMWLAPEDGPGSPASLFGLHHGLVFPIRSGESLAGMVGLFHRRPLDGSLAAIGEALARPVGTAVQQTRTDDDRRRLVDRLRAAEHRQRFLAEVGGVLASSLDVGTMLDRLLATAVSTVADACSAHLADDPGMVRRAPQIGDPGSPAVTRIVESAVTGPSTVDRVLRNGLPILFPEISDAMLRSMALDPHELDTLRAGAPVSAMVVPMPGRTGTLGALTFVTTVAGRRYGTQDLALAEDVGRRAGLAISSARTFQRERAIAATLQSSLLPPALPEVPGIEMTGRFRPGGEGMAVGGDFYDVFRIDDRTWAVGIGDVCGQGAGAAAITTRVRYSARAVARSSTGPAQMLEAVNELMLDGNDDLFCTAAYAWMRRTVEGVEMRIVRAGHPFPLVARGGGTVEEVRTAGSVLGVFDHAGLEETSIELAEGDLLLLYTDGIVEGRRAGGFFGSGRLVDLLSSLAGQDPRSVASAVEEQVLAFTGHRIDDDIAMISVRPVPGWSGR